MNRAFGPWATTLSTGPNAFLSTFWQRRMAMLSTLRQSHENGSWVLRGLLAVGLMAALALPTVYLVRPRQAAAAQEHPEAPSGGAAQALLVAADAPLAKAPAVEFVPEPSAREKQILEILEHPAKMDFVDTPLKDVVDFLQDFHAVTIRFDHRALEEAGVAPDVPVTLALHDVSLGSALRLMLRNLQLGYLITDEVLLITTADVAQQESLTRTYPVGDLVAGGDYQKLVEVITTLVQEASWSESGGRGSISEMPSVRSVVVSQTREVHDEILRLLRALRAAQKAGG